MGTKNVYERSVWFDNQVRAKKCPNATSLANQFEISAKTAQRDIDFMRDRLRCPLHYDTKRCSGTSAAATSETRSQSQKPGCSKTKKLLKPSKRE
jgi:hypothetical protein